MLPELIVVFTLSAVNAKPALSHDVYSDDMSNGEYYLHVEAARANMDSEMPNKIDPGWSGGVYQEEGMALFEVHVHFEADGFRIDQQEIESMGNYLNNGYSATYASDKQIIGTMSADDVMDHYAAQGGTVLAIASRKNAAMWLEVDRSRAGDYAAMQVIYKQLDDDRVLTIRGRVLFEDTTVDELKEKVDELVELYRDFPVRRYTGAMVR